ncbi:beta-phosphoglucomutase family hydrolase [Georgenia halophila]|uniref:Beta-phosphoglucomutase family hydrolase n=1 Tax=Georgenia halophila TaxID=620889 RepID=A0ABP8L5X2_9MICO
MSAHAHAGRFARIDAVLFDLDGVITPTAEVHMRAWSRLFTPYLQDRGAEPYTEADYFAHIDGRPRYEGVRALLDARGITIPDGDPTDPPDAETVCGLGNRKNDEFSAVLASEGVSAYPGSVRLVDALVAGGRAVAVVSSSKNAPAVLETAGVAGRFTVVVDGAVAGERGLAGKPAPDTFVHAAGELGAPVERTAVVEDALSGVAAGRAGHFGLVIGVDRGVGAEALTDAGADIVVRDLAELLPALDRTDTPETR